MLLADLTAGLIFRAEPLRSIWQDCQYPHDCSPAGNDLVAPPLQYRSLCRPATNAEGCRFAKDDQLQRGNLVGLAEDCQFDRRPIFLHLDRSAVGIQCTSVDQQAERMTDDLAAAIIEIRLEDPDSFGGCVGGCRISTQDSSTGPGAGW